MKNSYLSIILLFSGIAHPVYCQTNTDSVFKIAIKYSQSQHYIPAIQTAKTAIQMDPKRGDILVFIANVYSWQSKNDSALLYIQKAQEINYHQDEFYESWTNILLRSHQYEALFQSLTEAEMQHYSKNDILKKRLIAYYEMKRYDKGIKLLEDPENRRFIQSEPFNNMYTDFLMKRNTNLISAYYTLDFFGNGLMSQHLGSLGYSFKMGANNLGFTANYANRYGLNDVQLESNFYLMLGNKQYMYFNYGYAFNATLFPLHRAGLEYYFAPCLQFEESLGGRYMYYPGSNLSVLIVTGHLGKTIARNWVSIRPFYVYVSKNNTHSLSFVGNYRLFGKNALEYWGLELGYGNSPDEKYSTSQLIGFNQLKTYRVKVEKNIMMNRVSDFHIGIGYSREEYILNNFRDRYTLELGYKIRLK